MEINFGEFLLAMSSLMYYVRIQYHKTIWRDDCSFLFRASDLLFSPVKAPLSDHFVWMSDTVEGGGGGGGSWHVLVDPTPSREISSPVQLNIPLNYPIIPHSRQHLSVVIYPLFPTTNPSFVVYLYTSWPLNRYILFAANVLTYDGWRGLPRRAISVHLTLNSQEVESGCCELNISAFK